MVTALGMAPVAAEGVQFSVGVGLALATGGAWQAYRFFRTPVDHARLVVEHSGAALARPIAVVPSAAEEVGELWKAVGHLLQRHLVGVELVVEELVLLVLMV